MRTVAMSEYLAWVHILHDLMIFCSWSAYLNVFEFNRQIYLFIFFLPPLF